MDLNKDGQKLATMTETEAKSMAALMLAGKENPTSFTGGLCHDITALVLFLGGAKGIDAGAVAKTSGKDWISKLGMEKWKPWDGKKSIPKGAAVAFEWAKGMPTTGIGHSAMSVGSGNIRGHNSPAVWGTGWEKKSLGKVLDLSIDPVDDVMTMKDGGKVIVRVSKKLI